MAELELKDANDRIYNVLWGAGALDGAFLCECSNGSALKKSPWRLPSMCACEIETRLSLRAITSPLGAEPCRCLKRNAASARPSPAPTAMQPERHRSETPRDVHMVGATFPRTAKRVEAPATSLHSWRR